MLSLYFSLYIFSLYISLLSFGYIFFLSKNVVFSRIYYNLLSRIRRKNEVVYLKCSAPNSIRSQKTFDSVQAELVAALLDSFVRSQSAVHLIETKFSKGWIETEAVFRWW